MTDAFTRLSTALADRYHLKAVLGAGGMATVYRGEDLKHHREVAIKVLKPELAQVLGAERFLREIEISARLHHPHILPLFDSGDADGFLFYTMPLVEGESLRDRLIREKQLPIEDALGIALQVADALGYANEQGIVHRVVKPENILLERGHALVADFGIARAIPPGAGQTLTAGIMAIGTPAYMSPEQAAGEKGLDGRSDMYALGCVLYEMLAGQPPFTGPTVESVVHQHLAAPAPSVSAIRAMVPQSVTAALQRAMAKSPSDRFRHVGQFADALREGERRLREGNGTGTPTKARQPLLRGFGVLLALVAGAALAWIGWRVLRPGERSLSLTGQRQITREPELEIQVAVSPDGREVAYASGYPGSTHIKVRDVAGGRSRSLTGDWGGEQINPHWTPDGLSIRFEHVRATANHAGGVWIVPRMGGPAVAAGPGATVAMSRERVLEEHLDSLFVREPDGRRTLLATGANLHSPAWSHDGSRLAFVRGNEEYVLSYGWGNVAPSSIWIVSPGSAPVRVTEDRSLNVSPQWLPDGRLLFISNREGARDVYVVRLDNRGAPDGAPIRLSTGLDAFSLSVSADGGTLAYDRFLFRRNIFSLPIPRSGSVSIREARPVTSANQIVEGLGISRDGRWLTFDSNLDGIQQIYLIPAEGGEPRRLTSDPVGAFAPDFSPDGREIAFHSQRNATRDIYVVRVDGTGEQRLTSDSAESFQPAFSPDGLHLAYLNNPPHGVFLLRRDSIGGAWRQAGSVVSEGGVPRWSPDGTRLVLAGSRGIHIVTLAGTRRVVFQVKDGTPRAGRWPEWSPDGSTIYFRANSPEGEDGLYAIPAAGGREQLVVRFDDPGARVGGPAVSIGNGRFYFAVAQLESDIFTMRLVRPRSGGTKE